jgi:hypothetical protein
VKPYKTHLIRPPRPSDDKYVGDVNTQGILETVLYADPLAQKYTDKFAATLKGNTPVATAHNIWQFLKTQIPYVLDKTGYQWIKSPGRLWADKAGDCKSFSVFTASILRNLRIPYGYRFASYDSQNPDPTHVYVFIPAGNGIVNEIIIDAVWTGPFNTEKKYQSKKDYIMAKTSYLGAADDHKPGMLKLTKPIEEITDGEMDLLIARQRIEIEKANAASIGSPFLDKYDASLKVINHMLRNVDSPEVIEGIGRAMEAEADAAEAIGKAKKQKKGLGKFLQKAGQTIKKGVKAVTKVATAPVRLMAKGMLELQLPKASIMFLYLFTPADAQLPTQMARKKKKAEKLKKIIVNGIGMKEKHFMGIIRNALTKRFKKSPESFLQEKLRARVSGHGNPKRMLHAIHGIGGIPQAKLRHLAPKVKPGWNTTFDCPCNDPAEGQIGIITDIIGIVLKAVKWIVGMFKKNKKAGDEEPEDFSRDDVPDIERDMVDAVDLQSPMARAASRAASQTVSEGIVKTLNYSINTGDKSKVVKPKKNFLQSVSSLFKSITPKQADSIKNVAADILAKKPARTVIAKTLVQSLPFLNEDQVEELTNQIDNGGIAADYDEGVDLGYDIKTDGMDLGPDGSPNIKNGGGARGGFCEC